MSRYTIEMNFAKAKGQAKELDNAAARLERIASGSMEDAMSTISGNWKGENAGNYLRKAEILNVSRELKNTATAIRNIAQVTYNAEMAALELALKRNV